MGLPYDIARCHGNAGASLCEGCRRREPGREYYQLVIPPAIETQGCPNYIPYESFTSNEIAYGREAMRTGTMEQETQQQETTPGDEAERPTIERLVSYDEHEREMLKVIAERDYWESKATELANDVGELLGFDVGEHSNANCPVQRAIDGVFEMHSTVKEALAKE